ncbi:hypothetical protein BH10PSE19_BH10PSE19_09480 [soil metagenome]
MFYKKILATCLMLGTLGSLACSMNSYAGGVMNTAISNYTDYDMKPASEKWHKLYGSQLNWHSEDPIAKGVSALQVVDLGGATFTEATGYQGGYDLFDKDGNYKATCTITIRGYPGALKLAEVAVTGCDSSEYKTAVTKEAGADNGYINVAFVKK